MLTQTRMSETVTNPIDELRRIERLVRKFLPPGGYDHESIAVNIWIEATNRPVLFSFIRNRCIDAARRRAREELHHLAAQRARASHVRISTFEVSELLTLAGLDTTETLICYRRYWCGRGREEVSTELGMSLDELDKVTQKGFDKVRKIVRGET